MTNANQKNTFSEAEMTSHLHGAAEAVGIK
jgi:hypothetical protein